MHGSVFLDKKQQVIRPALLWNDQRTAAQCQEITDRAGGRRADSHGCQSGIDGLHRAEDFWLRCRNRRIMPSWPIVLLPKDEIRRRLTGELATDVSDASGCCSSCGRAQMSTPSCSATGTGSEMFATVYESEQVTGSLLPEVAKQLGLTTVCKVVAGAGDCASRCRRQTGSYARGC